VRGKRGHSQFRPIKNAAIVPNTMNGHFRKYQTMAVTIRNAKVCQLFRPDGAMAAVAGAALL
jgi:hypothetical protein